MDVKDVVFDNDDKNLFLIDDLQLKADAIRYSILPKLEIINNEIIARIIEVYGIDFYEHYSVSKSPAFRLAKTQRKEATKTDYQNAAVSITGQRKDDKWFGLDRGEHKVPKIQPTSLGVELITEGISSVFFFNHPKNFTKETYKKFFDLFVGELNIVLSLANKANLKYAFKFRDCISVEEDLILNYDNDNYDVIFVSMPIEYPIDYKKINELIYSNVVFFPILNACISIALGQEYNLKKDLQILEEKIIEFESKYFDKHDNQYHISEETLNDAKERAETKTKVQAGIRWQVFKRDNWKCIACGRSAEDNVILHIDHIIPRSKGGKDEFDNYQTLCETCNIGKSNKDDTDLRKKKNQQKR